MKDIKLRESTSLFKSIIIDESHKIKDGRTKQAKYCMKLTSGKEIVIELTGTPYVNTVDDLIPQLHALNQLQSFGGYQVFKRRYCSGNNSASNLNELKYKLHSTCFFRRLKSDVLKELPDRVRRVIVCDIDTRSEYDKAKNDFVKYLKEIKNNNDVDIRKKMKAQFIVQLGILKGLSAKGKWPTVS